MAKTHKPTIIKDVLHRARIVFSSIIIVGMVGTVSWYYIGITSGQMQHDILDPIKQKLRDFSSYLSQTENEPTASPSARWRMYLVTPTPNTSSTTRTTKSTYKTPRQTPSSGKSYEQIKQEQDAWWAEVQAENDRLSAQSKQELDAFRAQSEANMKIFEEQGQQGMIDFQKQNEAQMEAFRQKYNIK